MKILPAGNKTFPLIQQFILPYEYSCVLLASYVRKMDENISVIVSGDELHGIEDIIGVIYFNRVFLHCIPFLRSDFDCNRSEAAPDCRVAERPPERRSLEEDGAKAETRKAGWLLQFRPLILKYLDGKKLRCVNGEKCGSDFILQALEQIDVKPFQKNCYSLMTLEQKPVTAPEELSCDDELRRCYDSDFDALFDLQKKYLAKEVAPAGKTVTDMECSMSLRQILKNQLCFAVFSDGEAVSKANTNAIGFNWVQLGGVYTHPLYRKNYYAWNLVGAICNRVQRTGRKLCLFVRDKNNPAQLLYRRMGFVKKSDFEICYF